MTNINMIQRAARLRILHSELWKQGLTYNNIPYIVTPFMKEHMKYGRWPWEDGIMTRVPDHYKKHVLQRFSYPCTPVHWRLSEPFNRCPVTGEKERQDNLNVPIEAIIPKEAKKGLWGGEGIVFGFYKNGRACRRFPRFWRPKLETRDFYSEILDRWMAITVTPRTLDLIDDAYGFDFYILKTHEMDLKSDIGMKLKREMLTTLTKQSMYPGDSDKCEKIYNRYKEYLIPEDEIEWLGLTIFDAYKKQFSLEEEEENRTTKPLKDVFTAMALQNIVGHKTVTIGEGSGQSSLLSRLNPFGKKS